MIQIPDFRIEELTKKVATFNRKAVKLALPEIKMVEVSREMKPVVVRYEEDPYDPQIPVKPVISHFMFVTFDLIGELPRIGGWAVHSRVEPTEVPGQNYVYTAKGFEAVERLRTTAMECEHCNRIRRRSMVYLLQNMESGEQKLVGKSCLKDFLPNTNVEDVVKYLENLEAMQAGGCYDEDGEYIDGSNFPRINEVYPVDMLIAEALVLINKWGFVSKKMVREREEDADFDKPELCATSTLLANTGRGREKLYSVKEIAEVFESGKVAAVQEFIKAMDGTSDFAYNLKLSVAQAGAPWKMFGYVAAGVNQYLRSIEKAAERATKANEYLGEVGKREVFANVKLVRCIANEGYYGTTYITGFEDEVGNSIVWFGSVKIDGEIGDTMTIKATIKKHEEYKGRKQTVVTRVAMQ